MSVSVMMPIGLMGMAIPVIVGLYYTVSISNLNQCVLKYKYILTLLIVSLMSGMCYVYIIIISFYLKPDDKH